MKFRPQYIYFALPVLLLLAFILAYDSHQRRATAIAQLLASEERVRQEQADREQAELERRLEEEARRIAEAKAQALREREEAEARERAAKFEELKGRLSVTLEDLGRLQKTVEELRVHIGEEKTARKAAEDANFALGVEVENLRSRKAALDLEVQRLTGAIMDRFQNYWRFLTEVPAPK